MGAITIQRIIKSQYRVFDVLSKDNFESLTITYKWGTDSSSGQSQYKHALEN